MKPSKKEEDLKGKKEKIRRLTGELWTFWKYRRQEVNERWSRTLPFADYIVDRWKKAQILGFGDKTSVYDSCLVLGDVTVGRHTWIGPFTILDGSGGLIIGDYCSISAGVQIYTHDSVNWATSGGQEAIIRAPTKIGSRCYVGPSSVIGKGVTVGEGCIIGAMSLVICDIPPNTKVLGNPAKIVETNL